MSRLGGYDNPLLDIWSGLTHFEHPYASLMSRPPPRPEREATFKPLPPEVEEPLLRKVAQMGTGGLVGLGEALDKLTFSRALRGLLGGKPRELLSFIPFSDTLGITREEDITSGRELLEKAGWIGPNQEGLDWGDIAGIGTEIALDPSAWLVGPWGALTRLGAAAKKAGVLPRGVAARIKGLAAGTPEVARLARLTGRPEAELVGKPLGGLIGTGGLSRLFGLGDLAIGTGPRALEFVEKTGQAMQRLGELPGVRTLREVVRPLYYSLRGMFDPRVGGASHPLLQRAYEQTALPLLEQGEAAVRRQFLEELREARRLGYDTREAEEIIRQAAEGMHPDVSAASQATLQRLREAIREPRTAGIREPRTAGVATRETLERLGVKLKLPETGIATQETLEQLGRPSAKVTEKDLEKYLGRKLTQAEEAAAGTGRRLADELREILEREADLGFDIRKTEEYFPRYADIEGSEKQLGGTWGRFLETRFPSMQKRLTFFRGPLRQVETSVIEDILARMKEFGPLDNPENLKTFREWVANFLLGTARQLPDLPASKLRTLARKQAAGLVKWAQTVGPTEPGKFFFGSPLENFFRRKLFSVRATASAEAIYQTIRESMRPLAELGEEAVPLSWNAFKEMGLGGIKTIVREGVGERKVPAALLQLAQRTGMSLAELSQMALPKDVYQALVRFMRPIAIPEVAKPVVKFLDRLTNWFKSMVTVIFPAHHGRNLLTVGWQNVVGGAVDPTVSVGLRYLKPFADAHALAQGKVVKGIAEAPFFKQLGITDDAVATRMLAEMVYGYGLGGGRGKSIHDTGLVSDLLEQVSELGGLSAKALPGEAGWVRMPSLNPLDWLPRSWQEANPLNVVGVRDLAESQFRPVAQGEKLARYTDFLGRVSSFIAYLKQGYLPDVASAQAKALHYAQALTPMEREVFRRLIPFYAWSRRNTEFVLRTLLTSPMLETSAIRVANLFRDEGTFVPPWVGEGFSVPLPGAAPGSQRFLAGLGFPFEDETIRALGSLSRGHVDRAFMTMLSQLNPVLKLPLETATGTQLFSGRPFAEMKPTTGSRLLALGSEEYSAPINLLVSNTPLARTFTTLDKILQTQPLGERYTLPQTALNLLLGARIADVDVARSRELEASRMVKKLARGREGVKVFTKPYARVEDVPRLDPESVLLLRLQAGLENRLRKRLQEERRGQSGISL